MRHLVIVLLAFLSQLPPAWAVTAAFHELARYKLGGDGGWDCATVDAEARRLYIARANRVMVVDADSGALVGEVTGLDGAHAVVILNGTGFATSGKTGEVVAFDLQSLKITGRVHTGENPDILIHDSFSKRLFAFNGHGKNIAVIDPAALKVVATIALPGKPEFAVSDGNGRVFVNIEDRAELAVISAKKMKVVSSKPLKPCEDPSGLAYDAESKRLIVGCGNSRVVIVNADTGKVLQSLGAGAGIDGVAYDSTHKLAYVSAGDGQLTILLKGPKGFFGVDGIAKTARGARTLALDAKTGHVFLPSAEFEPQTAPAKPRERVRPKPIAGTFFVLVVGK